MCRELLVQWFEYIDELQRHLDDGASPPWATESGSSLALDNTLSAPLQIGHQVERLIHVATDHLSAVRGLIAGNSEGGGVLNVYADYTLIRAALEAAMIGQWLLLPNGRVDRVERCLMLMNQDFFDEDQASKVLAVVDVLPDSEVTTAAEAKHAERKAWSQAIAHRAGLTRALRRFQLERALSDVDAASERHLLLMWKIASGMAHGRQWAGMTVSQRTETFSHDDDTVTIRLEGDLQRVTVTLGAAVSALQDLMALFNMRRTRPACVTE